MTFGAAPAPVVVDASVCVDLVAEADLDLEARWLRWLDEGRMLLAPPLIWLELGNALLLRKRLHAVDAAALLERLEAAGLDVADRGPAGVRAALSVAERQHLTAYHASYLWLAIDIDGELATRDEELIRAARAEGVPLALSQ